MKNNANFSKKIIGMAMFAFAMILPISCGSTNSNNDSSSETETVEESTTAEKFVAGELGYLTDNCIGVVDTDDMSTIMKFLKANDMMGVQQMVASGKATTFAAGKQVKVIKVGFEYIQVRDTGASEMLVWVPKNMLTHEDIYGVYTSTNN